MAATIEPVAADEHNSGPDQMFEASSYVTSGIDAAVKLRIDLDDAGENEYPPISLPSMLSGGMISQLAASAPCWRWKICKTKRKMRFFKLTCMM